jgi:broad specificity phosphatase PhoE
MTYLSTGSSDQADSLNSALGVPLHMPSRLVTIRHGESEANLLHRALKSGIISEYPEGFEKIPDREIRLSKNGCQQAEATGRWLCEQYPERFNVIYVSDHTRAKETAGLICKAAGWHDAEIRIDPLLGERNWGRFSAADAARRDEIMANRKRDPLHNPMPDGETLLSTRLRSRDLLGRCAREFAGKQVLVISHGEYIEALWAEIAHMNTERQIEFFSSKEGDIRNCQVVSFSSVNPETKQYEGKLGWVHSCCPQAGAAGKWLPIERIKYTALELLQQVEKYPHLSFPKGLRL